VGGLPPELSVFELGFAGKYRVYYRKGDQARIRVLLVGSKASQKDDLDFLRQHGA
jgi:putative component of toxin-antitoxin plasmid stabilization module